MNPNPQPETDLEPPVPVATTTLHTGVDVAVAVTLSDGTGLAAGQMPQPMADDIARAVMAHLVEQRETTGDHVDIVPKVATVDVPLAIDLDHYAQWYAGRDADLNPSDEPATEPLETPDPKTHPQLAAEYVQYLLQSR